LVDQYELVKERTSNGGSFYLGSHVMQYGTIEVNVQPASHYLGRFNFAEEGQAVAAKPTNSVTSSRSPLSSVAQRDADMLHVWHKFQHAAEGSDRKKQALEEMTKMTAERARIDRAVDVVREVVRAKHASSLKAVKRAEGAALVDDWNCLKGMIRAFESECGQLTQYGMRHTRTFAELCNAGLAPESVADVAKWACPDVTAAAALGLYSA